MGASTGTGSRHIKPRNLLRTPEEFSRDPAALWLPFDPDEQRLAVLLGAYWQHLTTCAIREIFAVDPVAELARRLGREPNTHFTRQFTGEYRVQIDELCVWAFALGDVSILPEFTTADDLIPPGNGLTLREADE